MNVNIDDNIDGNEAGKRDGNIKYDMNINNNKDNINVNDNIDIKYNMNINDNVTNYENINDNINIQYDNINNNKDNINIQYDMNINDNVINNKDNINIQYDININNKDNINDNINSNNNFENLLKCLVNKHLNLSKDLFSILVDSGLIDSNRDITCKGFEFLLMARCEQYWYLICHGLEYFCSGDNKESDCFNRGQDRDINMEQVQYINREHNKDIIRVDNESTNGEYNKEHNKDFNKDIIRVDNESINREHNKNIDNLTIQTLILMK
ncbi:hypothetical protein NAPIS_ORF02484 [Vairimorpha apis BRL 01]|uniref:RNA polymerase II transcription factor B subunit 2 n=1 Tax=Vairimorpha apis BRL 01 TaxID=1037528 RepID=T0M9B0_9MICR|nr:hypothetical protein NAPIS_ORF02484 [Vairimorpha apis BRL 01]